MEVDGKSLDPKECFVTDTNSENIAQSAYQGTISVKKGNHSIKLTVESVSEAGIINTWHMAEQMLP
jgi:hypothetical protein